MNQEQCIMLIVTLNLKTQYKFISNWLKWYAYTHVKATITVANTAAAAILVNNTNK